MEEKPHTWNRDKGPNLTKRISIVAWDLASSTVNFTPLRDLRYGQRECMVRDVRTIKHSFHGRYMFSSSPISALERHSSSETVAIRAL